LIAPLSKKKVSIVSRQAAAAWAAQKRTKMHNHETRRGHGASPVRNSDSLCLRESDNAQKKQQKRAHVHFQRV
jgi:hypothetical protein